MTMPHALHEERAFLGGVFSHNELLDLDIIAAEDFFEPAHQTIYECMMTLHRTSKPIDTVTLRDALEGAQLLDDVGGADYLLSLAESVPAIETLRAHVKLIREKALVRKLITTCQTIVTKGLGDYGNAEEFFYQAERAVFQLERRTSVERSRDVVIRSFEDLHTLARSGERVPGLRSGFTQLDAMTAGMHQSDLIIVAARPGMGKTAFALNVAINASHSRFGTDKPAGVLVFSLEMPKKQLIKRMLASEARVDSGRIRTGQIHRDDWQNLAQAAGTIADLPIYIHDVPRMTVADIRRSILRADAEHGLCLVVIDSLQLIQPEFRGDTREREVSELARELKLMARELRLPIIVISTLNRGMEARQSRRPILSDLRDSGTLEDQADVVLMIYRDEVYNRESPYAGTAEIIVAKQRQGPTGTSRVRFFSQYTRFDNLKEAPEEHSEQLDELLAKIGGKSPEKAPPSDP